MVEALEKEEWQRFLIESVKEVRRKGTAEVVVWSKEEAAEEVLAAEIVALALLVVSGGAEMGITHLTDDQYYRLWRIKGIS